ncbi:Cytosine-specific methyltransferase [Rhynchospora pubera]|uniref:DNA (cytosine-5)-methyltransferase n=1 Tax=Rhynchospora pubera TaxID=906938 RepID=A0AAV8F7Y4_9POAL|nr:Cytosine-specific methyltransferase [Rhynchospora pubera]
MGSMCTLGLAVSLDLGIGCSAIGSTEQGNVAKQPQLPDSAGAPRKRKDGRLSTSKSKAKENTKESQEIKTEDQYEEQVISKRPRRAAACSNFKEKHVISSDEDSLIKLKTYTVADEEADAIGLTRLTPDEQMPPCRRLLDFVFHNSHGTPQPFEMINFGDVFVTAFILPLGDNLDKDKGVKCIGFGRVESWSISGYDEGCPIIWISTQTGDYECIKPASNYKSLYNCFYQKACICVEIYRKMAKRVRGNPEIGIDELLAGVIRSLNGSKGTSNPISREYIVSIGEFIYNQLMGLDEEVPLGTLPALTGLRDQCLSNKAGCSVMMPSSSSGGIKIQGDMVLNLNTDQVTEDEKLAQLLQENEYYQSELRVARGVRGQSDKSRKGIYIKISESEIASDYPMPAYYKPSVAEMDEYFFQDEIAIYADLPRRILSNWVLYNNDSRLISLEMIPMMPCAENDVLAFGSGYMRDDDGSGFEANPDSVGSGSGSSSVVVEPEGIPVYLSAVKEWMIEFGASMVFISIRTDVAWYRLEKPTDQYAPWYEVVLKIARLAIFIISQIKEQTRAAKLTFNDIIKRVSELPRGHSMYISSNASMVEQYIVVHGQIILQQFAEYPDKIIRNCQFVNELVSKMEQRRHTKLIMKKKVALQKIGNQNPNASAGPALKRKVMRATTTKFVNRIWGDYYAHNFPEEGEKDGDEVESGAREVIQEEEEQDNEDDAIELNLVSFQDNSSKLIPKATLLARKPKLIGGQVKWEGVPIGETGKCESLYKEAHVRGFVVTVGSVVSLEPENDDSDQSLYLVEYMYEKSNGMKMVHGRMMQRGCNTILGNAANEGEIFLTNNCFDFELEAIKEVVRFSIMSMKWGHIHRKDNIEIDNAYRLKAKERKEKGLLLEFYCKSLYSPDRGAFFSLPQGKLGLGTGICSSCQDRDTRHEEFKIVGSNAGFVYKKTEYRVHDFLYVKPQFFSEGAKDATFKGGRNVGLKAFVVCHLLEVEARSGFKGAQPASTKAKVRRFYRPDDISAAKAYSSDIREIYYSEDIVSIPVEMIEGKCEVRKRSELSNLDLPLVISHVFFCEYSYEPATGALKQLPANIRFSTLPQRSSDSASRKNKGKKVVEEDQGDAPSSKWGDVPQEDRLATLDIFSGCGGLSEGLQQSGVSLTKWAIEYEEPAGEAFRQNHPEAVVFIENCNVILKAIMDKCGDSDDSISTKEAAELAVKLEPEKIGNLPVPGEVDFINGGPPCQGFSGMNRFNQSTWSKVQCEMILAFLSFADYFRPRYFLLENVRNFVSFNKGQTFRLSLASLLDMGYQVRFGILEAGAFGVAQSRKRAFIWAAAPGEMLPEWPEPMHVFAGPELKVSAPGGVSYAAIRSTADGAPFRSITVRDAIGELPPVVNGASKLTIEYGSDPVSWFQKQIRGNMMVLNDHISKEMNELNLIRCQRIPRRPGADWRDLPDEKVKLSSGQTVDLIPWCLPNTARRHNQWKGLFGRLDWDGNFPTSVTDPQPMGKVGMCFHPEQDRIITVRECARSQGFPDSYSFHGNIQNRHRQIGNAVPPPLAYALGRKLKEAIDKNLHSC